MTDVANKLDTTPSDLSQLESGLHGLRVEQARAMAALYDLSALDVTRLEHLAVESQLRSWWDDSTYPAALQTYIGVEQVAKTVNVFSCSIIPGLLQTETYSWAMTTGTFDNEPDSVTNAVSCRQRRQEILRRPDPPTFCVVLDEAALHRCVGDSSVMREQLAVMIQAAQELRTSIRIIPFDAGAHVGLDSRFVTLHLRDEPEPQLVYVEGLGGYHSIDDPAELVRYSEAWDRITAKALSTERSLELISEVSDSLFGASSN
jgi:N-glycosylase/DNA lyase